MPRIDWDGGFTNHEDIKSSDIQGVSVTDDDTGETISHIVWYDTDSGELERFELNAIGQPLLDTENDCVKRIREIRRLRIRLADGRVFVGGSQCKARHQDEEDAFGDYGRGCSW